MSGSDTPATAAAQRYRRFLALLLLWTVLPLPFTGTVLAPFWLAVVAAAIHLWWCPPLRL